MSTKFVEDIHFSMTNSAVLFPDGTSLVVGVEFEYVSADETVLTAGLISKVSLPLKFFRLAALHPMIQKSNLINTAFEI
jgi:hypothetical protein